MRKYLMTLLTGIATGALVVGLALGYGRARALETFDLGEHDHIIAESPGCHVECRAFGAFRRTCTIRDYDCKPVCQEVPECNINGRGAPRVCAIIRQTR